MEAEVHSLRLTSSHVLPKYASRSAKTSVRINWYRVGGILLMCASALLSCTILTMALRVTANLL